ncbi:hypothetical protein QE429_002460 [Bacillus sp. SORGH_AS 510]|uniref:hypothetical protein n=1 Tax=Bacillus sp. SORGH_AS_0510 TaxID=3041771 RepID=UPI002781E211|nr:hypothetical protein [Bacillus sp. SORGH_AS_0510]MDQ1145633.1 hypothetical protein [Bacillus sp. SORGH_AS_0510]
MKFKKFLVGFTTFVLGTGLFYAIGHLFKIEWLMFEYQYKVSTNGLFVKTGSLVPFIIGISLSFIAEKVYANKNKTHFH